MVTCPECGKTFEKGKDTRDQAALRMHIANAHKKPPQAAQGDQGVVDISAARQRSETASETLEQKVARLRKERKPIGVPEKKWSCPENDGYHYRVFNDNWMARPNNIQRALAAGYEFVTSDNEKEKPQVVGTNDNGTPIKGYLMRIPKEIFDEDQKAKQREVDRVDEQIRNGSLQGGSGDGRYIPATGIKIQSDTRPPE